MRTSMLTTACGVLSIFALFLPHTASAATYHVDVFAPGGVPGTGGYDVFVPITTSIDGVDAYLTPLYEFPEAGTVTFGEVTLSPYIVGDQYGDVFAYAGTVDAMYGGFSGGVYFSPNGPIDECNGYSDPTCSSEIQTFVSNSPGDTFKLSFTVQAGDSIQLAWTEPYSYAAPTPLPAALPLFATGLGGLGLLFWRWKWKKPAVLAAA